MKIKSGLLKFKPEDFIVREIPLYELSHNGQHVFIEIKKKLLTTDELLRFLIDLFDLKRSDVGVAGLKDKVAVTSQWVSLDLGVKKDLDEIKNKIELSSHENNFPIKILNIDRHNQKLKRGHLKSNQFEILVRECGGETDILKATNIIDVILNEGMKNYYGPQRFGSKNDNHILGEKILKGLLKLKNKNRKKRYLEAYQSYLFNQWIDYRESKTSLNDFLVGDYLMEHERGRPIEVTEENRLNLMAKNYKLTGILYGKDNLKYLNNSDLLFLDSLQLDKNLLVKSNLRGGRRQSLILPEDIKIENIETEDKSDALKFSFSLPKGSYATVFLNNFFNELKTFKN